MTTARLLAAFGITCLLPLGFIPMNTSVHPTIKLVLEACAIALLFAAMIAYAVQKYAVFPDRNKWIVAPSPQVSATGYAFLA